MEQRKLGNQGLVSPAIALGCMSMSDPDARSEAGERESMETIREAVAAGVTLLDTGDFYGMGHNEMLIGRVLREFRRDEVRLSVKFGALRDHSGAFVGFEGRPAFVKSSLAYTLQRLGTDYVDFYFPARVDPATPIEETIGAVADSIREGKVLYAGLSEASAATMRRAHREHPVAAIEIEYSLWSREIEDEVLPAARELGIGILAYSTLSRGLLTGAVTERPRDFRAHFPRFQEENLAANLRLVESLKAIAARRGATAPQIAIAWALAQGEDIVAVVGTKRRKYLAENLGAAELRLTREELAEIERVAPRGAVAGERYPAPAMAALNG